MRFGTIFALLFSVVIIGLAFWWRFSETKPGVPVIYSVEDQRLDDYETALDFFTGPAPLQATTTEPAEPKPLTNTDIISRNMILSYLSVAVGNDDVKEKDLEKVAEHYLDQAVELHTFEKIGAEDIRKVADSEANARTYAQSFANIYSTYAGRMGAMFQAISAASSQEGAHVQFVGPVANVYSELAKALKVLPVPVSLSLLHLELTNIYLSNAAAMRAVQEMNEEPMTAMAGLVAIKENGIRESALLQELRAVFINKWGVLE